jgi:hypothetical protein
LGDPYRFQDKKLPLTGIVPFVSTISGKSRTFYMQMLMQVCASSVSRDGLTNFLEGHFTQLVWAASRHFGIGKARSRSGKIVVVAHYAPAGNISGAYLENVLPPSAEYFTLPPVPQNRYVVPSDGSTSDSGRSISEST